MTNSVDFDLVLSAIDRAINPMYLNHTQEIVLREVWQGKTYSEMAIAHNYDPEYIKSVGCSLWHTLSDAFNNQINKSNFVPFMRQQVASLQNVLSSEETEESYSEVAEAKSSYYWTTAPDTSNFIGREKELQQLEGWSEQPDCRCIVLSGMVGCGKTHLATKFAHQVKHKFDRVIWFSLLTTPPLKNLLCTYISSIEQRPDILLRSKELDLGLLLSRLVDHLRKERILLIVDGLQSVLQVNKGSISYRKEQEEYGQFLRSLVTTSHQSLLVATSRIKPKMLEYYDSNRVKFLGVRGLSKPEAASLFDSHGSSPKQTGKLGVLTEAFLGNPQLLTVIRSYMGDFVDSENEPQQLFQELCLIEEVRSLLERELAYVSELEREIGYWLAISCSAVSIGDLVACTNHSASRLKFGLDSLVRRSLAVREGSHYFLMPILQAYLKRKLVQNAVAIGN